MLGPSRRLRRPSTPPRPRPIYGDERADVAEGFDPYILTQQLRAAGCSIFERRVVMLFLILRSRAKVAARLKLPFSVVAMALSSAIEKLRVWREKRERRASYDGWLTVYIEEVNRWAYVDEHHCLPGEEACAKDGLCKYRWYLMREELL